MGHSTKDVGGGPAVGLGQDFISVLQKLLNSGGLGTAGSPDGPGSTGGIYGVLQDILSPGAGNVGGAFKDIFSKESDRAVAGLRSRFGTSGGTAFGSPAAYAESLYRSEVGPKLTAGIGNLQLQAIASLIPSLAGLASKGISQRQTVQQSNPITDALGVIAPIAGAAFGPGGLLAGAAFSRGIGGGGSVGDPNIGFRLPTANFDFLSQGQGNIPTLQGFLA